MIKSYGKSESKNKRFTVVLDNGKIFNFGYSLGSTYLDHGNKNIRDAYWKRHYGNQKEKYLIDNLIPSPAVLSAYLLWGDSTNIQTNIDYLNNLWDLQHKGKLQLPYKPDFIEL